jgi:glycosyltransferase involved in cell wall biosynthesis
MTRQPQNAASQISSGDAGKPSFSGSQGEPSSVQRRTAAHLIRAYLDPHEVFIHTQVLALKRYDVAFLAREIEPWAADLFPFANLDAYRVGRSGGVRGSVEDGIYRFLRRVSGNERRWYVSQLDALRPSVVHVHFAVDAAYFADVLRRADAPAVVSCYGYDVSGFPRRYGGLGRRYIQRAFKAADCFLAMSEDMRADCIALGCPPEKVVVHYYGIDLSRFPLLERPERKTVRILFVGALIDKKGVLDVLAAFERLARDYPSLELRFVGRGPRQATLLRRARAARFGDRVTFAGYVPNAELARELAEADIFCHPSCVDRSGNKEGIPGTIVEAAASGLPVVATRHAGIPVVVEHGVTGLLAREHDVDGLAAALETLVADSDCRKRMGRAGASLVRTVADADRQAARLEQIYDELIARR